MNPYIEMLAEKAAQGSEEAKKEGITMFTTTMASMVMLDEADQIAKAFNIPFEEQQSYASEALKQMSKMPEMKDLADEIKRHYKL